MRKAHHHVRFPFYDYTAALLAARLWALAFLLLQPFGRLLRFCFLAVLFNELVEHLPCGDAAIPDGRIDIIQIGHVKAL